MQKMKRNFVSRILEDENILPIERAIEQINLYISPLEYTGRLILAYSVDGEWEKLYDGILDGGAGKECAEYKIDTLIGHPEYNWGGSIPEELIRDGERIYYGSIKLLNCRDQEESGWNGEVIIAFSGRMAWQDVFYAAAVVLALESAFKMSFDLPPDITKDPFWGTALAICAEIFRAI